MAAPTYVTALAGVTDAGGAWDFSWALNTLSAAGVQVGDIVIAQVLQDGSTAGAVAQTGAAGNWVKDLAGSSDTLTTIVSEAPVGSPTGGFQFLYIGRVTSITNSGGISGTNSTSEDLYCRFYFFRTVSTGTTLATVIENATAGSTTNSTGTSNTASDASVQTLGPDRLALNFVGVNDDNAISAFTGETNGDWTLAVAPYADSGGTDGAIGLQISPVAGYPLDYLALGGSALNVGYSAAALKVAQSFSLTNALTLDQVSVNITKGGSPGDNFVLEIQTDAAGVPSGTVLSSASLAGGSIGGTPSEKSFALSATLNSGTTYWVVASRSGASDINNYYIWDDSSGSYSGGSAFQLQSGTWVDQSKDSTFRLHGTRYYSSGYTIDGGTGSIVDIDSWGVVGFALIGTTPTPPTGRNPRNPAVNFQDPAYV